MTQKIYSEAEIHALLKEQGHTPAFVPARPRKKRDDEESRNQRQLMIWWRVACRGLGVPEILLMAIPNGGGRSGPVVGSILKAEGLRKGAPDLFLAHSRPWRPSKTGSTAARDTFGLFLEMKTPTGRLFPEQEVFHDHLRAAGYCVEVARGWQQAAETITRYLKS